LGILLIFHIHIYISGMNTCGMVAWVLQLFTPEYPEGRKIVVIANDITFNIGSFGPDEDMVFFKASEFARKHGMVNIFLKRIFFLNCVWRFLESMLCWQVNAYYTL